MARPIDKGDTSTMTGAQFTVSRFHGPQGDVDITIGGSDMSSVYNISPWRTATELWRTKRDAFLKFNGKPSNVPMPVFTEEENVTAKALGHLYEPYVGQVFKKKMEADGHTVALITDKHTYQCGELLTDADGFPVEDANGDPVLKYPFALANVDGLPIVDGEQVLLECKTTSSSNFETIAEWKRGVVPPYYDVQVRWYMAIMDIDVAYIVCTWSLSEADCAIIRIDRDRVFEAEMLQKVSDFVQSIRDGIEPDPDEDNPALLQKYYTKLYGAPTVSQSTDISSDPEAEETIRDIEKIKREIASTEAYLAKLEEKLTKSLNTFAPLYGQYDKVVYSTDKYRCYITIHSEMTRAAATEESVSAVDPNLLALGQKFDSGTYKKAMEDEIKRLRKEATALKKAKDTAGMDAKLDEAKALEETLAKTIIPSSWKGSQKITVKFYDPKDSTKQVL